MDGWTKREKILEIKNSKLLGLFICFFLPLDVKSSSICMSLIKYISFLVILATFRVLFKSPSTSSSPWDSSRVITLYYPATHYFKLLYRSSQNLKTLLERTLLVSKLHLHIRRPCRRHKYRNLIMKAATVPT